MGTKIKKGLLLFLLIILCLPFAEQCFSFITSGPLDGGYKDADDVTFSVQGWLDGTYQHQKEKYLNDKVGFRPDLVRLNSQIDYSLFDICHSVWTVRGRDNYVFQNPYIEAYLGDDFIGYKKVLENSIKLKAIQDTLGHLGKSLILVYAASKASFYPEYFPDDRQHEQKKMTNQEAYKRAADSLGINQVDLDAWFLSMKHTSKELLFAKQGIHWTTYGVVLAADSLMRYVEKLRNIKIHHPVWTGMEHTTKPDHGDNDVVKGLNLIFPVATETFCYPIVREPDTGGIKPNVIYIGDSYAFKMLCFGHMKEMNTQCEYWGYFDDVHVINNGKFTYIRDYDWKGAMNTADCIVLEYTAFNLRNLGNGFIDQAYDFYYPNKKK